jgi:transcriptional regulator with XRE-family HTH domain
MDSDSPRSAVRRQVRAERERRGWSQSDLATAAGVSRGTIANLESGMHLTEGKEAKIESALGKPVGWLDDIRSGRTPEAVDFDEPPREEPARGGPGGATWGDLRRELAWWHGRLRDTPQDYQRLLYLLDLSAQLEDSPVSTQGGTQVDAQG